MPFSKDQKRKEIQLRLEHIMREIANQEQMTDRNRYETIKNIRDLFNLQGELEE